MRWSDSPRIREGLTPLCPVVPKSRVKQVAKPLSQKEIGQELVKGLDIILSRGVPLCGASDERLTAQG